MSSSNANLAPARRLLLAVVFAFSAPSAFAQAPAASNRDDLDVTMRTIVNPDATEPDEIVRKIPPPRARKPKHDDDDRTDDLAQPGTNSEPDEPGGAADPGSPAPDIPTDTGTPAGPGAGPGSSPDPREHPDDLGHQVSDDARHHGEEAHRDAHATPPDDNPHGPKSKPPGPKDHGPKDHTPKHPDPKHPDPKHPDPKPPGPGPKSPGGPRHEPPHGPPHGPPHDAPKPPRHGPGPRG